MTRFLPLLTASLIALATVAGPLRAQDNPFAPVLVINDRAITGFEIAQRKLFMQALGGGGDLDKLALDALIEDRLRMQEADRYAVKLDDEKIKAAMTEFAARANLTVDQFLAEIAKAGVAQETFRDFVTAGAIWREFARAKFGPTTKVSEEEIDRAIEAETRKTVLAVGVSELIMPVEPGREAEALAFFQDLRGQIRSEADFSQAVAKYSAAATRDKAGQLPVMPLAQLPGPVAQAVADLAPGQVSAPIPLPGAIALVQLRSKSETRAPIAGVEVEYGRLRLPATPEGQAEIARIAAGAERCKDVYGLAPTLPEGAYEIVKAPMSAVPADVGLVLNGLDRGEIAQRVAGGAAELLMLCARAPLPTAPAAPADGAAEGDTPAAPKAIDRNAVRAALINRKIEAQAQLYLDRLRANAIIQEP